VRGEGLAEKVGEVVISCTGGTSTAKDAPLPTINVQIFLSTYITSRLTVDGGIASEALLLIDEPQPGVNQLACPQGTVCSVWAIGGGVYGGGRAAGVSGINPSTNDLARPSMFQGAKAGENSIVWAGVPFDPPGTNGARVLRIVNIRANAANAGVSTTLIPTNINMFISISGTSALTLVNPQITVAYVQYGLGIYAKAKTYNQCEPTRDSNGWISGRNPVFNVFIQEMFPTAFMIAPLSTTAQNIPGNDYKTEAAFYNGATGFPAIGGGTLATSIGGASRATRIIVRFAGVPTGVSVYIPSTIQAPDLSAVLTLSTSINSDGTVPLSGGAGSVNYDVTTADANKQSFEGNANSVVLPLSLGWYASPLPGVGTATVTVLYGTTSTNGLMAYHASASTPRFIETPRTATTFTIQNCRTNLLFPYVTNQGGYDTGIAISNTSQDPFGTTGQNGTCTINYYGATTGGGAAPGPQTSATVNAGTQLAWMISAGGGIPATPGFQGFIIAQCNFQYAHGFAFISDYGANKVAEAYLALVMDSNMGSRTGASSELLGK
jgi:hypothetical protein